MDVRYCIRQSVMSRGVQVGRAMIGARIGAMANVRRARPPVNQFTGYSDAKPTEVGCGGERLAARQPTSVGFVFR